MSKLSEEYLREARQKFREVMQNEAVKPVADLARFKKSRGMIDECDRMLKTFEKKPEGPKG